jgi:branched-chain amino acid transport system substrate-binding protein
MPLRGPEAAAGRDVVHGARLAMADARGRAGALGLRAVYLDDTAGRGAQAGWSPAAAAANARRAAEDSTAIAYLGDFDSGASRFSVPITNAARMLQVSPASAAVDLVQPYLGAGNQVPDVQRTGERTFGRVIPSDEVQAEAGAEWANRLGIRRAAVVTDGSDFGRTLAAAFKGALRARVTRRGGQLLYYGGLAGDEPASPTESFPGRVMGSDALLPPFSAGARPVVTLATSAALDPSQLPPAAARFLRAFNDRYGRAPGRYAAYGYEAMAVVLDSIRRAGDSGDERDSVLSAFFDTRDRRSILGTYSIDDVGNTTLNRVTGYRVERGGARAVAELRVP